MANVSLDNQMPKHEEVFTFTDEVSTQIIL